MDELSKKRLQKQKQAKCEENYPTITDIEGFLKVVNYIKIKSDNSEFAVLYANENLSVDLPSMDAAEIYHNEDVFELHIDGNRTFTMPFEFDEFIVDNVYTILDNI